ncbi:sensor histidine kinase [Streptomyces albireticuli]|uniref:histidine kinase n=1 Tax=Streptomyces albireticuli TaxID=1940 RepID=A0A2A2DHD2_9ACTN|nr:histidine kinase [Streptomyces albireticuli]MCD9143947.1 histidine kinase [Streptomyces albireticuli]MCD9161622.1 histidine kinase [Streptomyces albireticuli]MCD9192064.1 histidine kinase [Streptomyces albireticuli]PAU50662.1 two-component sensor histidine kinase [Streptomyces albireticuli]
MAKTALRGIREDLFHDAFAFRPLPPLPAGHKLVRGLPGRARHYGRWFPHAVLIGFTGMVMLATVERGGGLFGIVASLFVGVPMVTTLFRPVGAWWLSVGSVAFTSVVLSGSDMGLWSPPGFFSHLFVLLVVALRTRPRVAAEMLALTGAMGLFLAFFMRGLSPYGGNYFVGDLFEMLMVYAMVLFVVLAVRGLRESKQQVVAQVAVTEVERSRRTVLEERTTIARELHDVVAHHMSVVAIQAEAAPYRVQDTPPELAAAFQTIRENAVAALTELRRVLGVVRSENPDAFADPEAPQPTLAALDTLLDNVRSAGLSVEHVTTGAVRPLPQGVELSAYRIVQEALSNVLRHAPGAEARVELGYVLGGLGLRIVNGPANRLAKPSPGAGHGVLGMRERVTMLGGEMTAEPTAEGGYEVTAFIPVPADEAAAA